MGGAAGHMSHPFDLPTVGNGSDLIKFFEDAATFLTTNPGSVKIDGTNVSFKLIDTPRGKEFAADRGSLAPIDIEGITIGRVGERFAEGHGMRPAITTLLTIFNAALPSIVPELKALGLYDDSTKFFNTEYVEGATNVLEYEDNFLAIHGVNQFYEKQSKIRGKGVRPGLPRPIDSETDKPIKDTSREIPYDRDVLASLIEKVAPYAKEQGFLVYGDIPTELIGEIDFGPALASEFTIVFDGFVEGECCTNSLSEWLASAENPKHPLPNGKKFEDVNGKARFAMLKDLYVKILNGTPLKEITSDAEGAKLVADAAVMWHASRVLGNAVLKQLTSDMGALDPTGEGGGQEGVIVRNEELFGPKPVKITGEFILQGLETSFPRGGETETIEVVDDEPAEKRVIAVYPGRFQPMGRHHAEVFKKIQDVYGAENSFIATSDVVSPPKSPFNFSEKQEIAAGHDIDPATMVKVKNPYYARELTDKYDPETTSVVYLVGAKDMAESPRFTKTEGTTKEGFDWAVDVAPHVSIDIPGYGEMSGTALRQALKDADLDTFAAIMGISDPATHELIIDKLGTSEEQLEEQKKTLSLLFSLVESTLNEKKKKKTDCFEEGKYKTFEGKSKCIQKTKGLSKERADAYVASVLRDMGELDEMSMAAGAVQGYAGPMKKKKSQGLIREDDLVGEVVNYLLNM